jgi:hypothetical protein
MFNVIHNMFSFLFDASGYISLAIVILILSYNMAVNTK